MNTKTEKTEVFGYKNRKTDLKMAKTAKPKIQCPPLSATSRENDLPLESYTESGKKVSLGIFRVLTFFFFSWEGFIHWKYVTSAEFIWSPIVAVTWPVRPDDQYCVNLIAWPSDVRGGKWRPDCLTCSLWFFIWHHGRKTSLQSLLTMA